MYEDDGVAVDEYDDEATDVGVDDEDGEVEEEILDVEDLLKTKNRTNGFHDIYDRKVVTFFENNEADDNNNNNPNSNHNSHSSGSTKDKRKSGGSSHSSFSSSSTSSGIISANNDEFKIIMKNNYECTLMMVNNGDGGGGGEEDNDDDEEEEESNDQDEKNGSGIRGFRMRQNGYGTLKTAGHYSRPTTTDREFNKRMSFSGDMNLQGGGDGGSDGDHPVYFSGSQNVMNQSFISADGVTRVLMVGDGKGGGIGGGGKKHRDDDHHIPKCMKLILGWYTFGGWFSVCVSLLHEFVCVLVDGS